MTEDIKISQYYSGKRSTSKHRGINFLLTENDIRTLLQEAGISIWQVGRGMDDYVLARKGDTGPYEIGNCRFIRKRDNITEWWESVDKDAWREEGLRTGPLWMNDD